MGKEKTKTLIVSADIHKDWKTFCSVKGIPIREVTENALTVAMHGIKKKENICKGKRGTCRH